MNGPDPGDIDKESMEFLTYEISVLAQARSIFLRYRDDHLASVMESYASVLQHGIDRQQRMEGAPGELETG